MIMMVSLDDTNESFSSIADVLKKTGEENGVEIRIQHEDIFNSMHKI